MASKIVLIRKATHAYNVAFACSQNVQAAISAYDAVMSGV
jgi:hypothetical protein